MLNVTEQLLLSVTVTAYEPTESPEISSVTAPVDHEYTYGLVPPVTERSIDPSSVSYTHLTLPTKA